MPSIDRDLEVVKFVAHFEAVPASQIRGVLFADNASPTPCKRVLTRLVERKYLVRFKWRYLPTARPGSAEYVYQLGPIGWRYIGYRGPYKKLEAFERHTIAIGDFYVALKGLERAGSLHVDDYETEPNSWQWIGNTELKPDLYAQISGADGITRRWWFEIDLGTEHTRQLSEKIRRYVNAWDTANAIPIVAFVVPDDRRKTEVIKLAERTGAAGLVKVCRFDEVATLLAG